MSAIMGNTVAGLRSFVSIALRRVLNFTPANHPGRARYLNAKPFDIPVTGIELPFRNSPAQSFEMAAEPTALTAKVVDAFQQPVEAARGGVAFKQTGLKEGAFRSP